MRRKCTRPALEDSDEEEEEGANSPAAKKLQIQRETITSTGIDSPLIQQQQAMQHQKAPPPPHSVRVLSRIAAQARSQKDPGAIA